LGKIAPVLMIVFGLFIAGIYYRLWDSCISFFEPYIIEDSYYQIIRLGWDAIPVALVIIGIIWLIKQGTNSSPEMVVYDR